MTVDNAVAVVTFDMWGQRCSTAFTDESTLHPVEWVMRCWDQGWMLPVEIAIGNVVIDYDELLPVYDAYQDKKRVGRIWKF